MNTQLQSLVAELDVAYDELDAQPEFESKRPSPVAFKKYTEGMRPFQEHVANAFKAVEASLQAVAKAKDPRLTVHCSTSPELRYSVMPVVFKVVDEEHGEAYYTQRLSLTYLSPEEALVFIKDLDIALVDKMEEHLDKQIVGIERSEY